MTQQCLLSVAILAGCADTHDGFISANQIEEKAAADVVFSKDYYNDPLRMDSEFETNFNALPKQAQAKNIPWTDTYWPKNKGGISYRWQTDESHTYTSPSYEEALTMAEEDLAKLSPAEKYDLFVGNKDLSLTHRIKAENQAGETSWQGYCHGWTQASIHFEEPQPVVMTNDDGLRIPFGSSDIKALLTYFQGEVVLTQFSVEEIPFKQATTVIGTLCVSNKSSDPACSDINPGAFHVIMGNKVGLRGEAFGIDATTTAQKWNQPVHAYQSEVIERWVPDSDDPAIAEAIAVRSLVTYTAEIEPQWQTTNGTSLHSDHTKTYHYVLYLDGNGYILGGEWATPLQGGGWATFDEMREYLLAVDDNGDGQADHTSKMVDSLMWEQFDIPDYAWTQERGAFSQTFKQAQSAYVFLTNNVTSRTQLYDYMAKLEDIYLESTR